MGKAKNEAASFGVWHKMLQVVLSMSVVRTRKKGHDLQVTTTHLIQATPGVVFEVADRRRRDAVYSARRGPNDGSVGQIIALLGRGGADVNFHDYAGVTPLYAAASRPIFYHWPNFLAVEAPLAHGANPFLYKENHNHWSIFHQLLRQAPDISEVVRPRKAVLRKLIQLGVDFDTRSCTRLGNTGLDYNSDGTPLFFAAAVAQDPECFEILLKAGARLDTVVLNREKFEMTEQSFLSGAGEVIALLLDYGSGLEDVNGEESTLQFACRFPGKGRDPALLDFLLEHATDKNVSLAYLEKLIAEYRCRYRHSEDAVADHYNAEISRLQNFRAWAFPEDLM
ncbi:hypothetical protein MKX07_008102 [Trichoderma sp. CBMAI-0711]|nr:hypothetical protein MKX07_008102 [Trichoderma sp. CBMAI-0711]